LDSIIIAIWYTSGTRHKKLLWTRRNYTKKFRFNWLQNLQRLEGYRILKQYWQYYTRGNRWLGRPMKRWSNKIWEPDRTNRIQILDF